MSSKNDSGLLYKALRDDPCRKLILDSKFSLAWTSEVNMKSNYLKGSVSSCLGTLSIDWLPNPIEVPEEVAKQGFGDSIKMHGPLRLDGTSTYRVSGPPCYIENAPFETAMDRLPDNLEVAMPFKITYHITNKTSLDQKLSVSLKGTEDGMDEHPGFIIAGLVKGEIALGPFETHTISYTALATRSGKMQLPRVRVSSDRYKTWLIEDKGPSRMIFVAP